MVENIEAEDVCKVIARKKKKRRGKAEQLVRVCVCFHCAGYKTATLLWLNNSEGALVCPPVLTMFKLLSLKLTKHEVESRTCEKVFCLIIERLKRCVSGFMCRCSWYHHNR